MPGFEPVDAASPGEPLDPRLRSILAALRKDAKDPSLWVEAARLYEAEGDRERALRCLEACLRVDPEQGEARATRARLEGGPTPSEDVSPTPPGKPKGGEDVSPAGRVDDERDEGPAAVRKRYVPWRPEEERTRLSPEEAAAQLERELASRETVACPACGTEVEAEEPWCFGCGQELRESAESFDQALERRLQTARTRLAEDEEDRDALFTLGAYQTLQEELPDALATLNRLTLLDADYPGLWWLKARVFAAMGKEQAAEAAMKRALKGPS